MSWERRPWGLYAYVALVYLFLFAPIILVVTNSFNADVTLVHWKGFTLHWYRNAWSNPLVVQAAKNSLIIAGIVTLLSAVLGTFTALALARSTRWRRAAIDGTTYARIVIPEIVLSLSLLIFLTRVNIARGTSTIILGHLVFNSAYVAVIVSARLAARDPATEEAARDLGATPFRAFWRVTLPEIMPGIVTGSLLAFTFSLENVVTSFFLSGSVNTLPMVVLSLIRFSVTPAVNAIGVTLMGVTGLLMILFLFVNWRWSIGSQRRVKALAES
jgi:spermidine/putrescine transport system permease protein